MRSIFIIGLAAATTPTLASAQQAVPPLETASTTQVASASAAAVPPAPYYAPPAVDPINRKLPPMTQRQAAGVSIARSWTANAAMPTHGQNGTVLYGYGETMPVVVCAPGYICDIQLEAGEIISDLASGDTTRWVIKPAESTEAGGKVTHVLLKPSDAGLSTNLVITTDRRTYTIQLVSRVKEWMPKVGFTYPEKIQAEWETFLANQRAAQAAEAARAAEVRRASVLPTGEAVSRLDFGFDIKGDTPAWRPLRVYSDGSKTYIEFPPAMLKGEAPVLVGVGPNDSVEMLNYRTDGSRFVVDQVVDEVALLSGVGRQQVRVEIRRARQG